MKKLEKTLALEVLGMFWKLNEIGWSKDMKEAARRDRAAIWWEKLSDEEKRKYMEKKAIKRREEERKRLEKQAKKDLRRLSSEVGRGKQKSKKEGGEEGWSEASAGNAIESSQMERSSVRSASENLSSWKPPSKALKGSGASPKKHPRQNSKGGEAMQGYCVECQYYQTKTSARGICRLTGEVKLAHSIPCKEIKKKEVSGMYQNGKKIEDQNFKEEVNQMQEAPVSFTVKFNYKDFDSQVTIRGERTDETAQKFQQMVTWLEKNGAKPDRRWEAIRNGNNGTNGNNKEPKNEEKKLIPGKDVCKHCGSQNMKSVTFNANGRRITRMKCQDCQKWGERIS